MQVKELFYILGHIEAYCKVILAIHLLHFE